MSKIIEEIKNNLRIKDNNLSLYATKNQDALYLRPIVTDYRLEFFKDIDKIIHSLSYTRYIENRFRDAFGFKGTPLRFIYRERKEKG